MGEKMPKACVRTVRAKSSSKVSRSAAKKAARKGCSKEKYSEVKDSGKRQQFKSGAVRDIQEGKGRFDLIPPMCLTRLAKHYENGGRKYGEDNWTKGMPLKRYLDSLIRHAYKLLDGMDDEDHAAAIAWNAFAFMYTKNQIEKGNLPKELEHNIFVQNKKKKCTKTVRAKSKK